MYQVDVNHHDATKVYQLSLQGNFMLEILFAVLRMYVRNSAAVEHNMPYDINYYLPFPSRCQISLLW